MDARLPTFVVALGLAAGGCARESDPIRYPASSPNGAYAAPGAFPPPGGSSWAPAPPAPPAPHAHPAGSPGPAPAGSPSPIANAAIGSALTTFGALLQRLPEMPPASQWGQFPWPVQWVPPGFLPFPVGPAAPPAGAPPLPGATSPPPTSALPPKTAPPTASPPSAPPTSIGPDDWPAQWVQFENAVLAETNARRGQGATCGTRSFGPAPAVRANVVLRRAARGHSVDMATRGYFDHTSPESHGPGARARAAGYSGGFVGENIAAGQPTPARVVQAWMESPGHCLNVMDPRYTDLGVGYDFRAGVKFGHFWTQNFGG